MRITISSVLILILIALVSWTLLSEAAINKTIQAAQPTKFNLESIMLPKDAIELKKVSRFPNSNEVAPYLSQPGSFVKAANNNIYIGDVRNNEIYCFDTLGIFKMTIGRSGQGPGDFFRPVEVTCTKDNLVIRDAGNMRIQLIDLNGKYVSSFKVFRGYLSIAPDDHFIFAASLNINRFENKREKSILIDKLNYDGQVLQSFGVPLDVVNPWLNQVVLSLSVNKILWVAFKFFPIIRNYNTEGKLLAEFRYGYELAAKKEAINIKGDKEKSESLAYVIQAIYPTADGAYLIDSTAGNRLVIIFVNRDGQLTQFFWAPIDKAGFICNGLYVQSEGREKRFFVLNVEEACVDIYAISR